MLFEPDSEVFADTSPVNKVFADPTPIADWLAANPSGRASLDGVSGDIELFPAAGGGCPRELIALGANAAQITTEVESVPLSSKD